jgi:hypothetical protein
MPIYCEGLVIAFPPGLRLTWTQTSSAKCVRVTGVGVVCLVKSINPNPILQGKESVPALSFSSGAGSNMKIVTNFFIEVEGSVPCSAISK